MAILEQHQQPPHNKSIIQTILKTFAIMETLFLNFNGKKYIRYYRVSVSGSMPYQTGLKIDAWTMAAERPQGSHVEHGTSVHYDYWLTMNELADEFIYDPLTVGDAVELMLESDKFFDSLFSGPKHDESYDDLYFRVLECDDWRDIDGVVKSKTRPSDREDRDGHFGTIQETYKKWLEIMTDCPELLPKAIYIHKEFKPEAVGDALAF